MSETTHDVTLKVSVVDGNLRLGPLDTSEFESSLDSIRQKLQDAVGSVRFNPGSGGSGSGGSSGGGFGESDAVRKELERISSVLSQIEQNTYSKVDPTNRGPDAIRNEAWGNVRGGFGKALHGTALLAASAGNSDAQRLVQSVVAIEGVAKAFSGLRQGIEGLSTLTSSLNGGFGSLAAGLTVAVGAIAAFAGGVALGYGAMTAFNNRQTRIEGYKQHAITQQYGNMLNRDVNQAMIRSGAAERMAGAQTGIPGNIYNMREESYLYRSAENKSRLAESDLSLSPEQQQSRRRAYESEYAYKATSRDHSTRLAALTAKQGNLRAAETLNLKGQADSKRLGELKIRSMMSEAENEMSNPDRGALGSSPEQKLRVKGLMSNIKTELKDPGGQERVKLAEQLVGIKTQQLQLEQEIAQETAAQNKNARQYAQEAHQAAQSGKDRIRGRQENIGMQDAGYRNRLKMIQDQYLRNEERRKENVAAGRDERAGFEEFSSEAMQFAKGSGNVAEIGFEEQARAKAKEYGFIDRDAQEQAEREKRAETADAIAAKSEKETDTKLTKSGESASGLEKGLKEAIVDAMSLGLVVEAMKEGFATAKAQIEAEIQRLKEVGSSVGF